MNRDLLSGEYKRFPKHWDVILFTKAFKDMTGGQTKIPKGDYLESGDIPIIDQGQDLIGGYTNERQAVCDIRLPCVVFGDHTKIFKFVTKPFALGADGVKVLSEANNIDPKFAYYFLNTLNLPNVGYSRHFRFLKRTFFPLPPLEEQRRIAAILDKADGVRRKRKEAIRLTEELLKSTFLEMFGDPVTNPKGWEKIKLGNLCTIVRGGSPRPINDYLGGSIPWIKIGDATEGDDIYIYKTAEAIKPDGVKKSRYLEPGSLIFANCGVSLGFARILKIAGCIHDGWLAFSDLDKSINQIFLLKLLNSITEHFRAIAPDGTQPNLNTTIMKNFEIPVPPIDLQEKFAVVSHYLTDSIKKNSEMFEQSENLFNSLLQRAFRGEL